MIVQCWKSFSTISVEHRLGQGYRVVEKLLDQAAEDVGVDQCGDLVTKLELLQDLLDIRREALKYASRSALSCYALARPRKSRRVKGEAL